MATGCLSMPKVPDIEGTDRFTGEVYFTSTWPHDGVDFTGKRVAVIGTGSSAVQSIPLIAAEAEQLTVFQRTPNFSIPARNGPISDERLAPFLADPDAYRDEARRSAAGVPRETPMEGALMVSDEERTARYEAMWEAGELLGITGTFNDTLANAESNDTLRDFIRDKIRSIVNDPEVAEALCPTNHYVGTKRACLDTNYYETYNLPHVRLVDLRKDPISTITETGIDTSNESFEFDAIVFATGFDAMTGAIVGVDITGRDGLTLKEKWADGPVTYLGLMTSGFPNLFMITGPGSPSVLSNMMVSIEQHVDWIADALAHLREHDLDTIEPTELAETRWVQHSNEFADLTLMPTANSWYMGANVPGKPRVFLPYPGGVGRYRATCDEVVERDYLGFALDGPAGRIVNDGIIRELKPDVQVMLETMAEMELPPIETMGVDGARAVHGGVRGDDAAGSRRRRDRRRHAARRRRLDRSSTACTGRRPTDRTRSSSTSTAAAGCSAARPPTIRSAATCASTRTRSSCRSTTATPPRHASRRPPTTAWPRRRGSPTTPRSSVGSRARSPSPDGAPAPTSPR